MNLEEITIKLNAFECGFVLGALMFREAAFEDEVDKQMIRQLQHKIYRQVNDQPPPEDKEKG